MPADGPIVEVDGRRLTLGNLTKVIFPGSGTTKGEVINYYATIAPTLLPHLGTRPITRKRWPDGTAAHSFFQKDLEIAAPNWVPRWPLPHDDRTIRYPTADSPAVLVWFGQLAALELHVPQWFLTPDGVPTFPDRVVFDLDPGPGATLEQCAEVAFAVKDHLDAAGLVSVPVTSGSKGLHLYARIDGTRSSDEVSGWAHAVARAVQHRLPGLAVSQMRKSLRDSKVFIDWSQNNGAKTTISPYSLRGRERPWVAAPRTWDEIVAPGLAHLEFQTVLDRVVSDGDLLAPLLIEPSAPAGEPRNGPLGDKLSKYRSMRDQARTPEPVPAPGPLPASRGNSFVIQEHHARALHWDFRLEHDGVLVSWAVPKGIPEDTRGNRLAVQTEDHPLEYGTFAGDIPAGEYGGGHVTIWDSGTYDLEKWRADEVIFTLHGHRSAGRYALIRTNGKNWLMHRTKAQPGDPTTSDIEPAPAHPLPGVEHLSPMLAAVGTAHDAADATAWSLENKWDGVRTIAYVTGGTLTLYSRNGNDVTATYPELLELTALVGGHDAVIDGEIVACKTPGVPSFSLLQRRMNLANVAEIARLRHEIPVEFYAFDLLHLNGVSLLGKKYDDRRRLLEALGIDGDRCRVPATLEGPAEKALAITRDLGLEGVVAKRRDSIYRPGRRSRAWLKIKNFRDLEVIIGGWKPGAGAREGAIGSLLVGVPGPNGLHYSGKVGTGFDEATLTMLMSALEPLRRNTSPFDDEVPAAERKDAIWVEPVLVGEISFVEWTDTDRVRASSWRGLRPDKSPADVAGRGAS